MEKVECVLIDGLPIIICVNGHCWKSFRQVRGQTLESENRYYCKRGMWNRMCGVWEISGKLKGRLVLAYQKKDYILSKTTYSLLINYRVSISHSYYARQWYISLFIMSQKSS